MSNEILAPETAERTRLVVEIPAITTRQLENLLEATGMTRTQLVILAIDRLTASQTLVGNLQVP